MAQPMLININGQPAPEQILGGMEASFVETSEVENLRFQMQEVHYLLANKPKKGLFNLWSAVQFICVVVFIGTNVHSTYAGKLVCEACGGYMHRYFQHLSSMTDWSHCPRQFNATVYTSELEKAIADQTILNHQQIYHKNPTPIVFHNCTDGRMTSKTETHKTCGFDMGDYNTCNKEDATFVPRSKEFSYLEYRYYWEVIPAEELVYQCHSPAPAQTQLDFGKEIKEITAKALNATMHSPLAEYESSCSNWVWALIVCEIAATTFITTSLCQIFMIARKYLMGCQFMQDNVEQTQRQFLYSSRTPSAASTQSTTPYGTPARYQIEPDLPL